MFCSLFSKSLLLYVISFICMLASNSEALAKQKELTISGFASIGGTYTSGNNFLGNDNQHHELLNLGINANYNLPANFSAKAQLAYRRAGESLNDNGVQIDYAFIDWSNNLLGIGEQMIAIGRVKSPAGLYNVTRDVPSSRPNIFLPQSIYLDIFRNLTLNVDGLQLRSVHTISDGIFSVEGIIGERSLDNNFGINALDLERDQNTARGSWDSHSTRLIDLKYNTFDTTIGFTYSLINTSFNLAESQSIQNDIPSLDALTDLELISETLIFSIQTHIYGFELTSEFNRRNFEVKGVIPGFPISKRPSEGYYAQIRYGFDNSVTLMARYDKLYRNADDKDGALASSYGLPTWAEKSQDYTLALNWVISKHVSMNSEVHFIEGSAWLPPFALLQADAFEKRHWTLFSTELVYKF